MRGLLVEAEQDYGFSCSVAGEVERNGRVFQDSKVMVKSLFPPVPGDRMQWWLLAAF